MKDQTAAAVAAKQGYKYQNPTPAYGPLSIIEYSHYTPTRPQLQNKHFNHYTIVTLCPSKRFSGISETGLPN